MAVNLQKNKDSLTASWTEVVDDKCPTTWVLLGYEGNSNDLKVVNKGVGDLEEMVDELNSGKIMYCFCKVKDPNSKLTKFILINWQGEGAPEPRKGICANHIKDIARLFHGAHVTINARTDEDVDPDVILDKVAKSSVANFNFEQERPQPEINNKPVGTVYKRTIAAVDINAAERDKFWERAEAEERRRKEEDQRKLTIERDHLEQERKKREEAEASRRDEIVRQRIRSISEIKAAEKAAENQSNQEEKKRWECQQRDVMHEEDERRQRSESLRQERKKEAHDLAAHKASSAKAFFEQQAAIQSTPSNPLRKPPAKIIRDFTSKSVDEPLPVEPVRKLSEPVPPVLSLSQKRSPLTEQPPSEPIVNPVTETLPHARNLLKEGLPQRQPSDEEEEEQDWESPPLEDGPSIKDPLQTMLEQQLEQVQAETYCNTEEIEALGLDPNSLVIRARALYDYQAADDTEISFDPDDIITHIEMIDEGWWRGLAPDMTYGLFPANYVELL